MQVELSYLNDKIDMVNSNIDSAVNIFGVAVAIAGVAFYFIAKQIVHKRVEKELPKLVNSMPQLEKTSGKIDIKPSYNNELNRARIGLININGTNIETINDIVSIKIYYYDSEDFDSIQNNNPSFSSHDVNILMNMRYKVEIYKYSLEFSEKEIVVYINQKYVPEDIFYEIVYRRY